MKRHPLKSATLILAMSSLLLPLLAGGCARRDKAPPIGPVPADRFVRAWAADLGLKRNQAEELFLRGDLVLLYTRDNTVYTFSAAGGELLWSAQVTSPDSDLRPPTLVGEQIVFPTISTLEVFNKQGRRMESIRLDRATGSPAGTDGRVVYIGLDYGTGGRLAKIDIGRQYGRTIWELMTFGAVRSTPVVYEDVIYAASGDGRVYAVGADRMPAWGGLEGNAFVTGNAVVADLRVDDFALYVASTDGKLYALDRATGRIKWQYFAGVPLRTAPVVTSDRVYQYVPGRGVVALNKTEGSDFRQALWVARGARQFLARDDVNVYARAADGAVVAIDRKTGQVSFETQRDDFALGASNAQGDLSYVATGDGQVLAVRPVLKAGTVGQIVRSDNDAREADALVSAR